MGNRQSLANPSDGVPPTAATASRIVLLLMGNRQSLANPSDGGPPTAATADADGAARLDLMSWIPFFGIGFLTYSSVSAIVRSIDDPWMVIFVVATYVDLILLFYCVRLVDRTPPSDSRRRQRLKGAVWSLASFLTAILACRVTAIMPPVVAGLIWGLSVAVIAGGFYALFIYREAPLVEVSPEGKIVDF